MSEQGLRAEASALRCRRDMFLRRHQNTDDLREKVNLLELADLAGHEAGRLVALADAEAFVLDALTDWVA